VDALTEAPGSREDPLAMGVLDFGFLLRLVNRNTTKTAITAATPSPISRIAAKLENSESMVCETTTVTFATMGLAVYVPELLLYCQAAVALMSWLPMAAFVGMRTGVSIILFVPAVRLNGKPEVI
jgi:hypothetical protein